MEYIVPHFPEYDTSANPHTSGYPTKSPEMPREGVSGSEPL